MSLWVSQFHKQDFDVARFMKLWRWVNVSLGTFLPTRTIPQILGQRSSPVVKDVTI